MEVTDENRTAGSGVLRVLTDGGSALSLEDHAVFMIVYSDNTSTNVLIDALGMDAVNELSTSLGATQHPVAASDDPTGAIAAGKREPVDASGRRPHHGEASPACDLPMGPGVVRSGPGDPGDRQGRTRPSPRPSDDVPIAFKPGGITGVATVWALVDLPDRPYVVVVMSSYGGDGGPLVESVSEVVFRYFSRLSGVTEYGTRVPLEIKRRLSHP